MPKYKPYTKRRTNAEQAIVDGFIRQVKTRMRELNINQKGLAALTGFGAAGLSVTLQGGHAPTIERMTTIAEALGLELRLQFTPLSSRTPNCAQRNLR